MFSASYHLAVGLGAAIVVLSAPCCLSAGNFLIDNGPSSAEPQQVLFVADAPKAQEGPAVQGETVNTSGNVAPFLGLLDAGGAEQPGSLTPQQPLWQPAPDGEKADFWIRLRADVDLSLEDYQHYYTPGNLGLLALGVAAVAPLANTSADRHIATWYQQRVRGETTDEYAQVMEYAGQLWVVLPLGLEAYGLFGKAGEDYSNDSALYEWGNRSLRSMAVGGPPMLALYVILGASRPDRDDSSWHPFEDIHGVSGHTFFGAVPLLTAAAMTDNDLLKVPLVMGSFLTGWARINDNKHYFSQVALGWWMAYLAVRSVNETQENHKSISFVPTFTDGPGVALQFRY